MIFWLYIVILVLLSLVIVKEMFEERDWKKQIALVMVLIPFILRIFLIK
ncbi:MAG: hypothetical protein KKA84_15485 [Bacteroidetes bacterium]|nr:hypothetical protein [Bacteroidota bacterium]